MRATLIAVVTAAGIGLLGTSTTFAAPASGTVLRDLNAAMSDVQDVRYCRWWRRCWHGYYSRRWCRVWRRCWW